MRATYDCRGRPDTGRHQRVRRLWSRTSRSKAGAGVVAGLLVGVLALGAGAAGASTRPVASPPGTQPNAAPRPSTPPPNAVPIGVDDDAKRVVAEHPAGTSFVLLSGKHELFSVVALAGDRFFAQAGTVLDGGHVEADRVQGAPRGHSRRRRGRRLEPVPPAADRELRQEPAFPDRRGADEQPDARSAAVLDRVVAPVGRSHGELVTRRLGVGRHGDPPVHHRGQRAPRDRGRRCRRDDPRQHGLGQWRGGGAPRLGGRRGQDRRLGRLDRRQPH